MSENFLKGDLNITSRVSTIKNDIDAQLRTINNKITSCEDRIKSLEQKFDGKKVKLEEIDSRIEKIGSYRTKLELKILQVEQAAATKESLEYMARKTKDTVDQFNF